MSEFSTQGYLDMELLRFTTAGSVDDGKSTLMDAGRIAEQGAPADLLQNPQTPRAREFLARLLEH